MNVRILLLLAVAIRCGAQQRLLWKDPGNVEAIDFSHAAGNVASSPRPPFYFAAEHFGGTSPKILARDSAGIKWRVKGGLETRSESFTTRLVAAVGYYADPTWFVDNGKIEAVTSLKRAAGFIRPDGSFSNASFELRDAALKSLSQDWIWSNNPFTGTRELNGLKILMMLVSNWDNKDARDRRIGSNTGISERHVGGRIQLIYHVTDWGQTLGAWGSELKPKGWDCRSFTAQTNSFVQGRQGQYVRFGFIGLHTNDFKNDITIDDLQWLLRYLGKIKDPQMLSGLRASGAKPEEATCFGVQLRERINQLQQAVTGGGPPSGK